MPLGLRLTSCAGIGLSRELALITLTPGNRSLSFGLGGRVLSLN